MYWYKNKFASFFVTINVHAAYKIHVHKTPDQPDRISKNAFLFLLGFIKYSILNWTFLWCWDTCGNYVVGFEVAMHMQKFNLNEHSWLIRNLKFSILATLLPTTFDHSHLPTIFFQRTWTKNFKIGVRVERNISFYKNVQLKKTVFVEFYYFPVNR